MQALKKQKKLRAGDTVTVISGSSKGKTGKILRVTPSSNKVVVSGAMVMKKAVKRTQNSEGRYINKESPIHISNVSFLHKGETRSKLGLLVQDGKKRRLVKKNGELI